MKPKSGIELREALEKAQALYRECHVLAPVDFMFADGEGAKLINIFLGGCVERGVGSSFRARAHAHNVTKDRFFGWICVRSLKRLGEHVLIPSEDYDEDKRTMVFITKPSRLLWHEFAHILTPNHSHDDTWRRKMRALGQPLPAQYRKKVAPARV